MPNENQNRTDQLPVVSIRMVEQPPLYSPERMDSPEAAIRVMSEFLQKVDRELMCVVNLHADLKPINMNIVSMGALNEAQVHPRELMKSAILSNAAAIMIIHNHPSGNLEPSKADIAITGQIQEACALMGIELTDHIITGPEKAYYSFREKQVLPVAKLKTVTNVNDLHFPEVSEVKEERYYRTKEVAKTSTIPLPFEGNNIDNIMMSLEDGVKELFTSDRYAEYLKTMAKFHNYSFNNTLLIAMQRPDASLVAGFQKWESMGRHVKRGEKAITIIAPVPVKRKRQREKRDSNNRPIYDANGKPVMEEFEVTIPTFKPTKVFDIGQTYGEPVQTLSPEMLTEAVKDYDLFMRALTEISGVPIRFDEIKDGANGYFSNVTKEIVIQQGMSESQTIKTLIHESGHARLHDRELMELQGIQKTRLTKEVEAESVAYAVCQQFGIDTSEYSFPYIAGWSSDVDMKELKESMNTIRQTAGTMIDELTEKMQELLEERRIEKAESEKEHLIEGMEAAGYHFDELESSNGNLRFLPDGTHEIAGILQMENWAEAHDWLEGVCLDDARKTERVERVMHPERFEKSMEEMMYEGPENRFSIYHIEDGSPASEFQFRSMDELQAQNVEVTADNYKCVYSAELLQSDNLDTLYAMFNDNVPADYKAHSMSVSDVVVMRQDGEIKAYYVEPFGFKELPDFVKQREQALGIHHPETVQEQPLQTTPHQEQAVQESTISFYVAECMEFPVMGEYQEGLTLEQAIEAYEKIPSERMNGVKGIGFELHDGSMYDGPFELFSCGEVSRESINMVAHYKDSPLVQKAMDQMDQYAAKKKEQKLEKAQEKSEAAVEKKPKAKKPRAKRKEPEL